VHPAAWEGGERVVPGWPCGDGEIAEVVDAGLVQGLACAESAAEDSVRLGRGRGGVRRDGGVSAQGGTADSGANEGGLGAALHILL